MPCEQEEVNGVALTILTYVLFSTIAAHGFYLS